MKSAARTPITPPLGGQPDGPKLIRMLAHETNYRDLAVALGRSISSLEKWIGGESESVVDPITLVDRLYWFALERCPAAVRLIRERLATLDRAWERRRERRAAADYAETPPTESEERAAIAEFHETASELMTAVGTRAPAATLHAEAARTQAALGRLAEIRETRRRWDDNRAA
jgi:hypothetical protein